MSPRKPVQKKTGLPGKTSERARYIELARQGLGNGEICQILGIFRRTGTKWRYGYTLRNSHTGRVHQYPPIADFSRRPQVESIRYLSGEDRIRIAELRRAGEGVRRIAALVGRSPSTISRELRRNAGTSGAYTPFHAEHLARGRRLRPRGGKIASTPQLREHIQQLLEKRWSPAQIAWHLRTTFPTDDRMRVAPETIYRDLYNWQSSSLTRAYCRFLRRRHITRKPSRMIARRRARFAGDVLMIDDRPFPPEDRSTPGAWEGDLIMGRHNRSSIATLVERQTRFLILLPVNASDRSASLRDTMTTVMLALPPGLRRSLTWDQGWEMTKHADITARTGMDIYFCDPHSPWQRGSNENMNGLLRDYFPKGTNLNVHSPEHLAHVAAEINDRPRAMLDWDTPANRLARLLNTTIHTPMLRRP